ncbi:hypothetical protein WDU94_009393 [Cyamophila willieti]
MIGLLTSAVTALIFSIIPSILFHFPDFRDPKMGFEARGTKLANRLRAWNLLLEATRPSGILTSNPIDDEMSVHIMNNVQMNLWRSSFLGLNKNKTNEQKEQPIIPFGQDEIDNTTPLPEEETPYQLAGFGTHHKDVNWTAIMELGRDNYNGRGGTRKNRKHKNRIYPDDNNADEEENEKRKQESYFCGPPRLKEILFDDLLLHDTWLIAAGAGSIVLFIYLYTSSLFLTGIIILTISQSLGVSFFFYTCVFNVQFFPFMNILAIIVALGIGSDDAFIVFNTWYNTSKEATNASCIDLYYDVLKHASIAICVTCVTTVAAFLTSIDSKITAVACFSIFASTTVVVNFVLMLLMLPSAIVLSERMHSIGVFNLESLLSGYVDNFLSLFTEAVFRLKYFWLIILSVITAMSAVIVLYNPTLRLPDTAEFQLFTSDHLFEQYDFKYKNMFFFETFEMVSNTVQFNFFFTIEG